MASSYTPTIGLEIHAELKTQTKMFCDSPNVSNETRPNVNVCPVCMAHPGTLPTINKEAVKHILKIGCAVGGELADFTEFDRKNYFYPDIPKGYQISQYEHPLVSGGELAGVTLTRIHLEEDTARSTHDTTETETLIDFNRAGVPLMELVTEPDITTGEQAGNFGRELQLLLRYLGVSDANMEKGEMRVEANVSVSSDEQKGTKVEVKNLNSFRSVERAIAHEIERQTALLDKGESVAQETRGWDETAGVTRSQRMKETSEDYRYFPDPDLPKMKLSEVPEFAHESIKSELPELPWEKRERYKKDLALKDEAVSVLTGDVELAFFFEHVAEALNRDAKKVELAANYITSDLLGSLTVPFHQIPFTAHDFAELIQMVAESEISSRGAKDILGYMLSGKGKPRDIAEEQGLLQQSDESALREVVEQVLSENPDAVSEYQSGKEGALQYLIGQGMKATKGSANPEVLKKLLAEALEK